MNKPPIYNVQQILSNQQLAEQIKRDLIATLDNNITLYKEKWIYKQYAKNVNHPRVHEVAWLFDKIRENITITALINALVAYLNSSEHFKRSARLCSIRRNFLRDIAAFKSQYDAALTLIDGNLPTLIFNNPIEAGPANPDAPAVPAIPEADLQRNPYLANALIEIENQKRVIRDLESTVAQQRITIQQQTSRIESLLAKLGTVIKNAMSFLRELISYKKTRIKQGALEKLLRDTDAEVFNIPETQAFKPSHVVINGALQAPAVIEQQEVGVAPAVDLPVEQPPAGMAPPPPPPPPPPSAPAAAPATKAPTTRPRAKTLPAQDNAPPMIKGDLHAQITSGLRKLKSTSTGKTETIKSVDAPAAGTDANNLPPPMPRTVVAKPATAVRQRRNRVGAPPCAADLPPPPVMPSQVAAMLATMQSTIVAVESTSQAPPLTEKSAKLEAIVEENEDTIDSQVNLTNSVPTTPPPPPAFIAIDGVPDAPPPPPPSSLKAATPETQSSIANTNIVDIVPLETKITSAIRLLKPVPAKAPNAEPESPGGMFGSSWVKKFKNARPPETPGGNGENNDSFNNTFSI